MAEPSTSEPPSQPPKPNFVRSNIFIAGFVPAFMKSFEEARNRYITLAANSRNGEDGGAPSLDSVMLIFHDLCGQSFFHMYDALRQKGPPPRPQDIITVESDDDDRNAGGQYRREASAPEVRQQPEVVKQKISAPTNTNSTNDGTIAIGTATASGDGSGQTLDVPDDRPDQKEKKKKVLQSPRGGRGRGSASCRRSKLPTGTSTISHSVSYIPVIPDTPEVPVTPATAGQTALVGQAPGISASSFSMSLRPGRKTSPFSVTRSYTYKKRNLVLDSGSGNDGVGGGDQTADGGLVAKPKKLRFDDSLTAPIITTTNGGGTASAGESEQIFDVPEDDPNQTKKKKKLIGVPRGRAIHRPRPYSSGGRRSKPSATTSAIATSVDDDGNGIGQTAAAGAAGPSGVGQSSGGGGGQTACQKTTEDKPIYRCKKGCKISTIYSTSITRHIKTLHLKEGERDISAKVRELVDGPNYTAQHNSVRTVSVRNEEEEEEMAVKPSTSGKVAMKKPLGSSGSSGSCLLLADENGPQLKQFATLGGDDNHNQNSSTPFRPFPIIKEEEENMPVQAFRSIAEMNNPTGRVAAGAVLRSNPPVLNNDQDEEEELEEDQLPDYELHRSSATTSTGRVATAAGAVPRSMPPFAYEASEELEVEQVPDYELRHNSDKSSATPSTSGSVGAAAGAAVRPFNDDDDEEELEVEQLPEIEFRHVSEKYKNTGGKRPKRTRPFSCSQCTSRGYATDLQLQKHVKSVHQGKKPFGCKWNDCDYSCADQTNALRHIKVHLKAEGEIGAGVADNDPRVEKYLATNRELL